MDVTVNVGDIHSNIEYWFHRRTLTMATSGPRSVTADIHVVGQKLDALLPLLPLDRQNLSIIIFQQGRIITYKRYRLILDDD